MSTRTAFLLAVENEGRNALTETLAAHPEIHLARDAHVLTALAHLGYYDKVNKAPYDHILAAEAQRLFVERLPRKEADYIAACRAYCDTLYARALEASGKALLLDATAQYLDIQPFLRRLFPNAPCIVVTRHPLVLLAKQGASSARRTVECVAALSRSTGTLLLRVRAEDFADEPTAQADAVCAHLGVAFEASLADAARAAAQGIASVEQIAGEWLTADRLVEAQRFVRRLSLEDLAGYGYSLEEVWLPFDAASGRVLPRVAPARFAGLRRRTLKLLRNRVQNAGAANRIVRKVRLACDVLLRR